MSGTLNNCTLTGNSASYGGGAEYATLNNCIVYYNTAPSYANSDINCTLNYCCTKPLPAAGTGNLTNAPLFVNQAGGNVRLQTNSPCINAGLNAYASGALDLAGNPRISGGTVDIGAYEFQFLDRFHAWLQFYGLPTDGSADYADADADRLNNWQEWVAGTNPTNAASVLRVQAPVRNPSSLLLRWSSVSNRTYFVERATNLVSAAFSVLETNIPGLPDTTSFTDTNPPVPGPAYYRVGVQP